MQSWILRSTSHVPFVGLHGGWGPRMMNIKYQTMDHPNKKRTHVHLENDSAPVESTNGFPRFLVIESCNEEQPLTKLSPFIIEKVLISIAGSAKSVKKLRTGGLLVEVEKPQHSKILLALKKFYNISAKCSAHSSLNSSRGIIRCPDLAGVQEEEIVSEHSSQGVIEARRICVYRDNVRRDTNTIILKFNTAILPKVLKIGYLKVPVDV